MPTSLVDLARLERRDQVFEVAGGAGAERPFVVDGKGAPVSHAICQPWRGVRDGIAETREAARFERGNHERVIFAVRAPAGAATSAGSTRDRDSSAAAAPSTSRFGGAVGSERRVEMHVRPGPQLRRRAEESLARSAAGELDRGQQRPRFSGLNSSSFSTRSVSQGMSRCCARFGTSGVYRHAKSSS